VRAFRCIQKFVHAGKFSVNILQSQELSTLFHFLYGCKCKKVRTNFADRCAGSEEENHVTTTQSCHIITLPFTRRTEHESKGYVYHLEEFDVPLSSGMIIHVNLKLCQL
jgi:hypothetical protein